MKKSILFATLISVLLVAFQVKKSSELTVPQGWPKPLYNFAQNPLSEAKIQLGRALFYDPILSVNNQISCASCHSQYNAFAHVDHALSHGIDDRIGTRNAPALMNLAWQNVFMWDGSVNHLDMQSLFPITHPDEMGEKIEHVVSKLQLTTNYPTRFYQAFGDSVITGEHLLKSISQFMLILVSQNARYDSMMRNQIRFTPQEQNGYVLFNAHCASCHAEPLFNINSFENNGLPLDTNLNDLGRMKVTHNVLDSLKFKVPTLRNIEFTYPYMHDGRFKKLSQVINHYTSGVLKSTTLSEPLKKPIILTSNEKVDLISFLLTLTDKNFLFNPELSFPKFIGSEK